MASYASAGTQNTYLQQIEAAEDLHLRYIRNPAAFALQQWAKTRSVGKMKGKYFRLGVDQFYRITAATLNEARWPDGKRFPGLAGNTEAYELKDFETERFGFGFEIGGLAQAQAQWDVVRDHADGTYCRMMTLRTQRAVTEATTTANLEGNTATQATILGASGRGWDVSDAATKFYIKKSIDYAVSQIMLASRSSVSLEDFKIVFNPTTAKVVAESPEITDMIKYTGGEQFAAGSRGRNAHFGLPEYMYGCKIVVEDAVKVTTYKGDTQSASFIFPDYQALICVRRGGPTNGTGESETYGDGTLKPGYDSVQVMEYGGGMEILTQYDSWNRIHEGQVVDNSDIRLVAPRNTYLITALTT